MRVSIDLSARADRTGYTGVFSVPTRYGAVRAEVRVPAAAVMEARRAIRAAIVAHHDALHAARGESVAGWSGVDIVGDGDEGVSLPALLAQGARITGAPGVSPVPSSNPLASLAALLAARAPAQGGTGGDPLAALGALLRGGASPSASPLAAPGLDALLRALAGPATGPQGGAGAAAAAGALRSLLAGGRGGQNAQGAMAGLAPLLALGASAAGAGAGDDSAQRGLSTGLGALAALAAGAATAGPVGLLAAIPALVSLGMDFVDPSKLVLANRQRVTQHADIRRILPPAAGPSREELDRYARARYAPGSSMDAHERAEWSAYMAEHGWPEWERAADVPGAIRAAWDRARDLRVPILDVLAGSVAGVDGVRSRAPWRGTSALWDAWVLGPTETACDAAHVARRVGASELAARVVAATDADPIATDAAGILDAVAGLHAGEEEAASYLARAVEDVDAREAGWRLAAAIDGCASA